MYNKLKSLLVEYRTRLKKFESRQLTIEKQTKELEWAHVYHDSIRGKLYLEQLSLNIGRWAGNYAFFYVLNRILSDFKPQTILEFGLGESSKMISVYLENELTASIHTIVEQDADWIAAFQQRFQLSIRSKILCCPLTEKDINGFKVNSYSEVAEKVSRKFDLYIVDGPFGSARFSRYDIIALVEQFERHDEFVILLDDTNRIGEQDTLNEIINVLKLKNIPFYIGNYHGNKSLAVVCTEKYEYAQSL
ncbi:hypothetical protein ACSV4D_12760 [Flavobacterium sp. ARAG 55.4]|uniref:hypothetical protein n=1 Tax=Flavobacterium sp. ARAG 55.4 TaxID=3451357 RepID=UPI003F44E4DA